MAKVEGNAGSDWSVVKQLLDLVRTDPEAKQILMAGTPEQKKDLLQGRLGLTLADLERMHSELQEVTGQQELGWWFW